MIRAELSNEDLTALKVGTAPTDITVMDGPYIRKSIRGYYPVLKVKVDKSGILYHLAIGSRSLTEALDPIFQRKKSFLGLKLRLSRKNESEMSPYVVEEI